MVQSDGMSFKGTEEMLGKSEESKRKPYSGRRSEKQRMYYHTFKPRSTWDAGENRATI